MRVGILQGVVSKYMANSEQNCKIGVIVILFTILQHKKSKVCSKNVYFNMQRKYKKKSFDLQQL